MTEAGINAIGTIGSTILGGIGSIFGISSANDANERMARENRDWQEMMWNKQNAYNAPSNQLALYQEAGYNPLTALNKMAGVPSAGTVSTPNAATHLPYDGSFLGQAVQAGVQSQLVKEQADNLHEDTVGKKIENLKKPEAIQANIDQLNQEVTESRTRVNNLKQEFNNLKATEENLKKQGGLIDEQTTAVREDNQRKNDLQKQIIAEYDAQIAKLQEEKKYISYNAKTARISANASARSAEASMISANASKEQARIAGELADISIERWEMESGKKIPPTYSKVAKEIALLDAQGKHEQAKKTYQEFTNTVRAEQGEGYYKWMDPETGYIPNILRQAGVAEDVLFVKPSEAFRNNANALNNTVQGFKGIAPFLMK